MRFPGEDSGGMRRLENGALDASSLVIYEEKNLTVLDKGARRREAVSGEFSI